MYYRKRWTPSKATKSVESSNAGACRYDEFGNRIQVRDKYHPNDREDGTVYIHASKTRIIEIYTDLKNGYELDGRGNRKKCVPN